MMSDKQPLHVFAYGSLMWRPGFDFDTVAPGAIGGFHRRFCIWSQRYRGTPEAPGLVLGLMPGGSCRGLLYTVAPERADEARAYLWDREMVNHAYAPRAVSVMTETGMMTALTFVADPRQPTYAAGLCEERIARIIAERRGECGTNLAYFESTLANLERLGAVDAPFKRLRALLARLRPSDTPEIGMPSLPSLAAG